METIRAEHDLGRSISSASARPTMLIRSRWSESGQRCFLVQTKGARFQAKLESLRPITVVHHFLWERRVNVARRLFDLRFVPPPPPACGNAALS